MQIQHKLTTSEAVRLILRTRKANSRCLFGSNQALESPSNNAAGNLQIPCTYSSVLQHRQHDVAKKQFGLSPVKEITEALRISIVGEINDWCD